jgi:hypothetical protein
VNGADSGLKTYTEYDYEGEEEAFSVVSPVLRIQKKKKNVVFSELLKKSWVKEVKTSFDQRHVSSRIRRPTEEDSGIEEPAIENTDVDSLFHII